MTKYVFTVLSLAVTALAFALGFASGVIAVSAQAATALPGDAGLPATSAAYPVHIQ